MRMNRVIFSPIKIIISSNSTQLAIPTLKLDLEGKSAIHWTVWQSSLSLSHFRDSSVSIAFCHMFFIKNLLSLLFHPPVWIIIILNISCAKDDQYQHPRSTACSRQKIILLPCSDCLLNKVEIIPKSHLLYIIGSTSSHLSINYDSCCVRGHESH